MPRLKRNPPNTAGSSRIAWSGDAKEQDLRGLIHRLCARGNSLFRPLDLYDKGIDGEIEFNDDQGDATGRKIYLQLKSGDYYLRNRQRDGRWIFDVKKERHLKYWADQPVDVYLVVHRPDLDDDGVEETLWMNVTEYLENRTDQRTHQIIFEGESLDREALLRCRERCLDQPLRRRPPSPVPLELPPAARKFFGRKPQLAELAKLLKARENAIVVGPPGIGKTALAAAVLKEVVGTDTESLSRSPFPGGVLYVDLYRLRGQSEAAWNHLADRLRDPRFREDLKPEDRARAACKDRHVLVVIEGGEMADGQEGRATFSRLREVFSPENRWLLLTRNRAQTPAGELVEISDALDEKESRDLLRELTRKRPIPADLATRLLRMLSGHPLALSWAAGQMATGTDTPRDLIEDWDKDPRLMLAEPDNPDHTLAWLFRRSVDHLTDNSRRALQAAGLLAHAPFSFELIREALGTAVGPTSKEIARAALRALAQRSLLRLVDEHWEFTHAVGYRLARPEHVSEPQLLVRLGRALRSCITDGLATFGPGSDEKISSSLEHCAAILQKDPDQHLWPILGIPLLHEFGTRLVDLGHLPLASLAQEAVAVSIEGLPSLRKRSPEWLREQAVLSDRRGQIYLQQGDLAAAHDSFLNYLRINQGLAESNPANPFLQQGLSVSFDRVGEVAKRRGNLAAALDAFEKGLKIGQKLVQDAPHDLTWQRSVSVFFEKSGEVLREQGDLARALDAFIKSLEFRQSIAQADLANSEGQRDLSVSYEKVGDVQYEHGDLAAALDSFRTSLEIGKHLARKDPSNSVWQHDMSLSYNKVGQALFAQDEFPAALEYFRKGLEINSRLVLTDPSNTTWQQALSVLHAKVGDVLREQGDVSAALLSFHESLKINQKLTQADPSNFVWHHSLSACHERIGGILFQLGFFPSAITSLRKAVNLREILTSVDATNSLWQRDLSISLYNLGVVILEISPNDEALSYVRRSLEIHRRLVERDPTNAVTRWQLAKFEEGAKRYQS